MRKKECQTGKGWETGRETLHRKFAMFIRFRILVAFLCCASANKTSSWDDVLALASRTICFSDRVGHTGIVRSCSINCQRCDGKPRV